MEAHGLLVPRYYLAVLGTGKVGKSALAIRFVRDEFLHDRKNIDGDRSTTDDRYFRECVVDGTRCLLYIIVVSETRRYSPLMEDFLQRCDGFMFVYALDNGRSFHDIPSYHDIVLHSKKVDAENTVRSGLAGELPIVLVGTKCDLPSEKRFEIDYNHMGRHLGAEHRWPYVSTSAKTGQDVDTAFHQLVREIRRMELQRNAKPKAFKVETRKKTSICILL